MAPIFRRHMIARKFLQGLTASVALAFTAVAQAQLPQPQLTSLTPPGAKKGSKLEITVVGADLDDASQLLFTNPKIKSIAKTEATEFAKTPKTVPGVFSVDVPADIPEGIYEARVVGRFGISNPRAFVVGSVDELVEAAGNNSLDKAMELAIGPTVNGKVDANGRDYFKVSLQQGQRVLIECVSKRIDSKMDAALILYSPEGKELLRTRDPDFADAVIDFTAPATGNYVIAVHDFVYGGGADYFYRLSAHTRPKIDFVFPPSGTPGSNATYTVYGRNLPGGKPADGVRIGTATLQQITAQIAIPADAASQTAVVAGVGLPRTIAVDGVEFRVPGSQPTVVFAARAPIVAEKEPNNTAAAAQKITVPAEFVGQFYPSSDVDWFQFDAKKGDSFVIEVLSHRMGLSSDPALTIQKLKKNEKGEESATDVAQLDDPADRATRITQDFDTSTDDPSYRLNVTEDATYRVAIRDQFGTARHDPRVTYRVAIRQAAPDFRLVVTGNVTTTGQNQNQQGTLLGVPVLRRGGTAMFQVTADRADDFKGDITIQVEGLPKGISCPPVTLSGDATTAPLIFTATEDAEAWAGTLRVVGKSQVDGKEVVRVARAGTVVWGSANRQQALPEFRVSRDAALAVADKQSVPVSVSVEDKLLETSLGATLEIPVTVKRNGDFKEAMKLAATGLPTDIKPAEVNVDGNTTTGKLSVPLTAANIKAGTYTFYLKGDAKFKYVRNPDMMKTAEEDQKFLTDLIAMLEQKVKEATTAKEEAAKAKETPDALAKAEQALKDAQAKLATAKQKKTDADKKVADAKTAVQPKDATLSVISTPIRMKVAAAPFKLAPAANAAVKQGDMAELVVKLERQFGFADVVDLTIEPPAGVAITAGKASIAKDQGEVKLELKADKGVAAGDHVVKVRGKGKFNNVNVEAIEPIVVKVQAAN